MDNEQFSLLLDYFSFSWEGYQKVKKGVKKRILRHMNQTGCRDIQEYIQRLGQDSVLRYECECLLSVPISRFFRDPVLWKILAEEILPRFFRKKRICVWSAGCAGGEEVYSLKIAWHQLKSIHSNLPFLKITASDLSAENLDRAKKGVYQSSSLKEVPADILSQYFEKGVRRKSWGIKLDLKRNIKWEKRHLLYDPPPKGVYDIIFLRNNILLYASKELKTAGFKNVVSALADDGFLITGTKDTLPPAGASGFRAFKLPYIFKKIRNQK